jgi:hypothetical protein
MPEDDSLKPLLEKLCSLQEQQLAKLSELVERSATARERIEKLQDLWQRSLTTYEESQKKAGARAAGQTFGLWIRTALTVFMLGLIALAIIIAHYLK